MAYKKAEAMHDSIKGSRAPAAPHTLDPNCAVCASHCYSVHCHTTQTPNHWSTCVQVMLLPSLSGAQDYKWSKWINSTLLLILLIFILLTVVLLLLLPVQGLQGPLDILDITVDLLQQDLHQLHVPMPGHQEREVILLQRDLQRDLDDSEASAASRAFNSARSAATA